MRNIQRFLFAASVLVAALFGHLAEVNAGAIFGFSNAGLGGGYRWDAAPRITNISGTNYERSLDGGLRYSVQGGSFQAFRDLFTWQSVPSVPAFQTAVQQAFDAWKVTDPVTGLASQLNFVPDLGTGVVGVTGGSGGVDTRGAEIDLFGKTDAAFWNPGNSGTQGETWFNASSGLVKLTSGTTNYAGSAPIAGADITINSNPQAIYSLDFFRRLLTHEIGHAIGLGDVEGDINPGAYIDDNYNGANSAAALSTLTNSWAALVNPFNPAASPLSRYTVPYANPGTQTTGVNILMESRGLGLAAGNPVTNLTPLTNDDFGTRQFLYPFVPEPSSFVLAALGLIGLVVWRRRRRH